MKLLLASLAFLFTACATPNTAARAVHAQSRTVSSKPVAEASPAMPQMPSILDFLTAPEEKPVPDVVCESKDGIDRCVPKYRFSDEVNEQTSKAAVAWLNKANDAGADEILIEFNTPGGSIPDGFELARAIEDSKAPVSCVVDGNGESMGFYLLQSCNTRYMTKRSKLMAHEPSLSGGMSGQPNRWQAIADMMKAENENMIEHCSHRLKISREQYVAKTEGGRMWFLLWQEALKVGAIDEIGRAHV